MKSLAVLFWVASGGAAVAWAFGDPDALTGVVGAGICAVAFTVMAVLER